MGHCCGLGGKGIASNDWHLMNADSSPICSASSSLLSCLGKQPKMTQSTWAPANLFGETQIEF